MIHEYGPPDATVIVSTATNTEFDDDTVNDVLASLGEAGEIILVRLLAASYLSVSTVCRFLVKIFWILHVSLRCITYDVMFLLLQICRP